MLNNLHVVSEYKSLHMIYIKMTSCIYNSYNLFIIQLLSIIYGYCIIEPDWISNLSHAARSITHRSFNTLSILKDKHSMRSMSDFFTTSIACQIYGQMLATTLVAEPTRTISNTRNHVDVHGYLLHLRFGGVITFWYIGLMLYKNMHRWQ